MDLAEAGGADRLTVRDQPTVGVHRQRTVDLERTVGDERLLLPVRAEAVLGEVDDLRPRQCPGAG